MIRPSNAVARALPARRSRTVSVLFIGDPAYDRLRKAVETFGLVEPLVWNKRSGNFVGGHQRLSVLEERGAVEVEVSVVDLAPREEKALNLALNKHSGEWDFAALADMLTELSASDFDMEVAGFNEKELKELMAWRPPNAGLTDEDAVPEAPKVPVTKPGDLIRMRFVITNSSLIWRALMKGNHVRLCAYRNAVKAPNKR